MSEALEQFLNKNLKRAEKYREIIKKMMCDYHAYHYAENTLLGILDYIEENNTITNSQIKAVENIKNKPNKHYEF